MYIASKRIEPVAQVLKQIYRATRQDLRAQFIKKLCMYEHKFHTFFAVLPVCKSWAHTHTSANWARKSRALSITVAEAIHGQRFPMILILNRFSGDELAVLKSTRYS